MARSFNGTSDLIAIDSAHIVAQSTAYAIAFWIKAAGSAVDEYCYAEGSSGGTSPFFGIHQASSGKLNTILRNGAASLRLNVTSVNTQRDNTWHHFIFQQDASNNYAMFTDGTNKETGSYTASGTFSVDRATIAGIRRNSISNWMTGNLAEVALFNRILSDKEALSLGNGLPASFLGPRHYWPLWGSDSPEPDLGIGTHVSGTLTGTTRVSGGKVAKNLLVIG